MANGNFGGGDGTASKPYLIEDSMDFYNIRNFSDDLNVHFEITKNIDMSKPPFSTSGLDWTAISFNGNLDGKQYKISNLTISKLSNDIGSIFNSTTGSIKNILFENINITPTATTLQSNLSIFGNTKQLLKIENIGIKNSKIESKSASTASSGFIFAMWNGYQSAGSYVKNVIIENCELNLNYDGYLEVCFLIGASSQGASDTVLLSDVSIANCRMNSNITQSMQLRLFKRSDGMTIKNIFVDLNIIPSGKARLAGSFSALLGSSTSLTNVYYNKEKLSVYTENGGLTKDEMKLSSSYNGWDFADTWLISKNGYPELRIYKAFENKTLILNKNEYKKFQYGQEELNERYLLNMTSTTSPSPYKSSASSAYSTTNLTYPSWKAFDGIYDVNTSQDTQFWANADNSFPCWVTIDFGEKRKVNYLHVYHVIDGSQTARIKNFKIQGSNDGSSWIDLKAFNNEVWVNYTDKKFYLDSLVEYRHYRLYITENNGFSRTTIAELVYGAEQEYKEDGFLKVSTTSPTLQQFLSEGMDSLSPLLDRKVTTLEPMQMQSKSDILPVGREGKVFSKTLDLKKYLDIRSMKVEVK